MQRTSLVALGIAVLTTTSFAQKTNSRVDPVTASSNAEKLIHDITWIESQPTLTKEATAKGKLIFYVHMLGNLAGNT